KAYFGKRRIVVVVGVVVVVREVISNAFFNSIDVSFCILSTERSSNSQQSLCYCCQIFYTRLHDRNNHDDMWDTNGIITRMLILTLMVLWSVILSTSYNCFCFKNHTFIIIINHDTYMYMAFGV